MSLRLPSIALAGLAIAGAIVLALQSRADSSTERIKHAIAWPQSCADVVISDTTGDRDEWPHAAMTASITCEHLGPFVLYARYDRRADLRTDLLRHPPGAATCIAGHEVVIDGLDPGQFAPLCRRLGGDRVDAVSKLPEIWSDNTIEGIERAVRATERRNAAAQKRALRRYWAAHERRPRPS
jgi:hypothetical protein